MRRFGLISILIALVAAAFWWSSGAVPEQALVAQTSETDAPSTQTAAPAPHKIRIKSVETPEKRQPVPAKMNFAKSRSSNPVPSKLDDPTSARAQAKPVRTVQNRAVQPIVTPLPAHVSKALPVQKCINMGGALEAPREGDWGYRVKSSDLRLIARSGFDTIRLPVKWSAHLDKANKIDPALFNRTDQIIRDSLNAGLKVILDVHHYDEFMDAPEREMPRLRAMWTQISNHYADWPDELIFELLNEVNGEVTVAKSNQVNKDLLALVRAKNPNRWVVLGSGNWGSLDPLLADAKEKFTPPQDPRVINSFHYYDDFDFTHQGAPFLENAPPAGKRFGTEQQKAEIALHMRQARAFRDRTNQPLLIGEFGVYRGVPDAERAKWTKYVRQQADAQGLGWCYWDWATEFKAYDPSTGRMVPGFQDALFGK